MHYFKSSNFSVLFGLILLLANPVFAEDSLQALVFPTEDYVPLRFNLDASLVPGDIDEYQ